MLLLRKECFDAAGDCPAEEAGDASARISKRVWGPARYPHKTSRGDLALLVTELHPECPFEQVQGLVLVQVKMQRGPGLPG